MNIPPLCIIQARMGSTRLPGKMLLTLGEETLIARAYRIAREAFGVSNVVIAIPHTPDNMGLWAECKRLTVQVFLWDGNEPDVLGRFHACANHYRWHPDTVIVRYTPDDWAKTASGLKYVASTGVRLPVETCGEAFTLAMLNAAHNRVSGEDWGFGTPALNDSREHLTYSLFPTLPPTVPKHPLGLPWSIDTQQDYEQVKAHIEGPQASPFDGGPWSPC